MTVRQVQPVAEWILADLGQFFAREPALLAALGFKSIAVTRGSDARGALTVRPTQGAPRQFTVAFDPDTRVLTFTDEQERCQDSEPLRLDDAFRFRGRPFPAFGMGSRRLEQQRALATALFAPLAKLMREESSQEASYSPDGKHLTPQGRALTKELIGLGHLFPAAEAPRWQQRQWCQRIDELQSELRLRPWQRGSAANRELLAAEEPDILRVLALHGGFRTRHRPLNFFNTHGKLSTAASVSSGFAASASVGVGALATTSGMGVATPNPAQGGRYGFGWLVALPQTLYSRTSFNTKKNRAAHEHGRVPHRLLHNAPRGAIIRYWSGLGSLNGIGRALLAGSQDPPAGMDARTNRAFAIEVGTRWVLTSNGLAHGSYHNQPRVVDRGAVDLIAQEILENSNPLTKLRKAKNRSWRLHRALDRIPVENLTAQQRELLGELRVEHESAWEHADRSAVAQQLRAAMLSPRPGKEVLRNAWKVMLPQFLALGATYPVAQSFGHPELTLFAIPNVIINLSTHARAGALAVNKLSATERHDQRIAEQRDESAAVTRARVAARLGSDPIPPQPKIRYRHRPELKPYLKEVALLAPTQTFFAWLATVPPSMRSTLVGMVASNAASGPLKYTENFIVDMGEARSKHKAEEIDDEIEVRKLLARGIDHILAELTTNTRELRDLNLDETLNRALADGLIRTRDDETSWHFELAVDGEHAAELQGIWDAVQETGLDEVRRHFLALLAAAGARPERLKARLSVLVSDYEKHKEPESVLSALRENLSTVARTLAGAKIRWAGLVEHLPPDEPIGRLLRDFQPFDELDVLDPEALRFARVINALPDDDEGERLAAIAVEVAATLGGVSQTRESALDVEELMAWLPPAALTIARDVRRVRDGQSLIAGMAEPLNHERSTKAVRRHLVEQLARIDDVDAPLYMDYGGDRSAYLKQVMSQVSDDRQSGSHQHMPTAKLRAYEGGGILDLDKDAIKELLVAHGESITFSHSAAVQAQATMNGEQIAVLHDELTTLLKAQSTHVTMKYLEDGSALAAISQEPFDWKKPEKTPGFLLQLRDVREGQEYATAVSVQGRITGACAVGEEPGKLATVWRSARPARLRRPAQLSASHFLK